MPNLPSRTFCVDCGTFIGSGSSTASPLGKGPYAAATLTAAAVTPPSMSGTGTMTLGSYSLAVQSASARRRVLTVTTSGILAGIVGLMAIYVATSSIDPGPDPAPAAALVVAGTPIPTAAVDGDTESAPRMEDTTPGKVVADPERTADPALEADPELEADPALAAELARPAVPAADAATATVTAPLVTEDDALPEPARAPAEVPREADDPPSEPVAEAQLGEGVRGGLTTATAVGSATGPKATPRQSPVSHNGWVCDGEVQLQDPRGRDWSLGRVSFRVGRGYERVVLHMNRLGPGLGAPSTVTAKAYATSKVRRSVPGVRRPSAGQTTVSLHLSAGIEGNLDVRGYRPSGLQTLKEFSVYPAGRGARQVLVSATAEECFRLRVPAWTEPDPTARNRRDLPRYQVIAATRLHLPWMCVPVLGTQPPGAGTPSRRGDGQSRPLMSAAEASTIEMVAMRTDMRVRPRREARMAPGNMAASDAARIEGSSTHWGWTSS